MIQVKKKKIDAYKKKKWKTKKPIKLKKVKQVNWQRGRWEVEALE